MVISGLGIRNPALAHEMIKVRIIDSKVKNLMISIAFINFPFNLDFISTNNKEMCDIYIFLEFST
jgi:hypothetical protein